MSQPSIPTTSKISSRGCWKGWATTSSVAPKGKDGGLDLLAQRDPLGVEGPRIKGQVKRRPDHKTTEEEPRSFLSLVEPSDVGVYISLGGFTSDCAALARRTSRRITLIDGDALLDLWVEHFDRMDEDGRQLLPIKPVYYLDPSSASA
jgi:restriction system protein